MDTVGSTRGPHTLEGLHIDGPGAGSVGLPQLRRLARELGKQAGVEVVHVQGGIRTTGATPGHLPRPITIRVNEWRMPRLVLTGWRAGLDKVALTKLLQDELDMPLGEAKHQTDSLLAGSTVELTVSTEQLNPVAEKVQRLGVIVERLK